MRYFTAQHVLNILWMNRINIGFLYRFCFKQRHWTEYAYNFGFCFKIRFRTSSLYNGFPHLFFIYQVRVFVKTNFGSFIITEIFTFKYFLKGGGVWARFSHNSWGTKIIRSNAIWLSLLISVPIKPDNMLLSCGTIIPPFEQKVSVYCWK